MTISSLDSATVTLQQLIDANKSQQQKLAEQLTAMIETSIQKVFKQAESEQAQSTAHIPFQQFRLDSRQLEANDVFILLKSQTANPQKSRDYLLQAAEQAAFILSEIDPIVLLSEADNSSNTTNEPQTDSIANAQQQLAAYHAMYYTFLIFVTF